MKARIIGTLESAEAERVFRESTGRDLPRIPDGANTLQTPFVWADENGAERAALLVQQRGFERTPLERAAGEEVDGTSVFVAADSTPEEGAAVLAQLADSILAPHELAIAKREVFLLCGVSVRYTPCGDGIEAILADGAGEVTAPGEIAAWLAAHPAAADEIQSTRLRILRAVKGRGGGNGPEKKA